MFKKRKYEEGSKSERERSENWHDIDEKSLLFLKGVLTKATVKHEVSHHQKMDIRREREKKNSIKFPFFVVVAFNIFARH